MTEPASKPEPLASSLCRMSDAALAYAKKWNLIDDQGDVWCSYHHQGCDRKALLPSLACPVHLAEYRRGR